MTSKYEVGQKVVLKKELNIDTDSMSIRRLPFPKWRVIETIQFSAEGIAYFFKNERNYHYDWFWEEDIASDEEITPVMIEAIDKLVQNHENYVKDLLSLKELIEKEGLMNIYKNMKKQEPGNEDEN